MKNGVKNFVLLLLAVCALPSLTAGQTAEIRFYIRVNQLGFRPRDVKIAVAFGHEILPATFRVLDANTRAVVFTGKTVALNGSWGDFAHHAELNFSSLRREG